ncbi:hypothetical protein EK21DRAFT_13858, partial [Setomelanomma holmii]
NSTTHTVGWASEPDGRGTIGLLWSCFATMFLCIWNAIHLNVPAPSDYEMRIFGRRIRYVLWCLLAPEYFASMALNQFVEVRRLQAKSPGWSLKKCYFFMMRGFVYEVDSGEGKEQKTFPVTEHYRLIQEKKLPWPEVDDRDIANRARADWILKSIAVAQVLWFITQIIGRAAQGLAVITLELFTIGNVFCAILMYSFMWEKPYDVRIPVII